MLTGGTVAGSVEESSHSCPFIISALAAKNIFHEVAMNDFGLTDAEYGELVGPFFGELREGADNFVQMMIDEYDAGILRSQA